MSTNADEAGDNLLQNFEVSQTGNKWCQFADGSVLEGNTYLTCATNDQAKWELLNEEGQVTVTQDSAFACKKFNVEVQYVNSETGTKHGSDSTEFEFNLWEETDFCKYDFETQFTFVSDTIKEVEIKQTHELTKSALCGEPSITYVDEAGESATPAAGEHTWTAASETGVYNYYAKSTFGLVNAVADSSANNSWKQACKVQIDTAEIQEFAAASYTNEEEASATILAQLSTFGDCGETFEVVATLIPQDGAATIDVSLNVADASSENGQTVTVEIPRTKKDYKLKTTYTATDGTSADEHNKQTTGEGFDSVITADKETENHFTGTPCHIEITSFKAESMEEESNWEGDMIASYSGSVYAEASCGAPTVTIEVFNENNEKVGEIVANAVAGDDLTYTVEADVNVDNLKDKYYGAMKVQSSINESKADKEETDAEDYSPPCYLEVLNFAKQAHSHSINENQVAIDFGLNLAQHGDKACNNLAATVVLANSTSDLLTLKLSENDVEVALSEYGFNFTTLVDNVWDGPTEAIVTFTDVNAADNASKSLGLNTVAVAAAECAIEVREFCLDNVAENEAGTIDFTFDLTVVVNPVCQELTASLDIVNLSGEYLYTATIDHE